MRDRSFLYAYVVSIVAAIFATFILFCIRFTGVAFISWLGIFMPIIIVNAIYCLFVVIAISKMWICDAIEKRNNKWITKDLKEYF